MSEGIIGYSQLSDVPNKSMNVRFYLSFDIKIILKSHYCRKNVIIFHYVHNSVMDVITFPKNLQTTSGLLILLHGIISLPEATSYDNID